MVATRALKGFIASLALAVFTSPAYSYAQAPNGAQPSDTPLIQKDALTQQKTRAKTTNGKKGRSKTSGKTTGKDDWQAGASGGSKGSNGKIAKDGWENGSPGGSKGGNGKIAKDGWENGSTSGSKGGSGRLAKDGWQSGSSGGSKGGKSNTVKDDWPGSKTGKASAAGNDRWQTNVKSSPRKTHKNAGKTLVDNGKTGNPQPGPPKSDQPK